VERAFRYRRSLLAFPELLRFCLEAEFHQMLQKEGTCRRGPGQKGVEQVLAGLSPRASPSSFETGTARVPGGYSTGELGATLLSLRAAVLGEGQLLLEVAAARTHI
jgi:hypothetical protein